MRHPHVLALILGFAGGGFGATAHGQTAQATPTSARTQAPAPGAGASRAAKVSADCARAQARGKACQIEFKQGETLEAGVPSGEGESVTARLTLPFSNLIRLRSDFHDAMLKTAESLP